ncbi:AAA family ATPase [Pseudomonas sp. 10B238]|uniref:AAA family ATPase n=1 Tax=Pseudomonas sp. 10B238 TaxID=1586417 RepID=UPI0009E567B6|nr:AAA family ATPase [Pseudomonas sp. 10B238]
MKLRHAKIKNFRLLADVQLALEDLTTVVVGRNNSGKTSLSEIIRRLLAEGSAAFQLEDFSSACYDRFCTALEAHNNGQDDDVVRALIPFIELRLTFEYDPAQPQLGPLSPFVIDLDPDCNEVLAVVRYELKDGQLAQFFSGQPDTPLTDETRIAFFRSLRERIPTSFAVRVWAEDPNDAENNRQLQPSALKALIKTGFINAQRGLDDITSRESDVLAKTVELLFATASSSSADEADKQIAQALKEAVQDIQSQIDSSFGGQLNNLIPALKNFGYPGLGNQELGGCRS